MTESILLGLMQNTAILLSFSMLYDNVWIKREELRSPWIKVLTGAIIGAIGIVLMLTQWTMIPGIVFDTRSVMISVAGLFFGAVPTIIAMMIDIAYRWWLGGDGVWMGISVILSAGTTGILWREIRPDWMGRNRNSQLLQLGITVHIIMLASTILLPEELIVSTLKAIVVPVVLVYIPATVLLGRLMSKHYDNWQNKRVKEHLLESERRFSGILKSSNLLTLVLDTNGHITFCNQFLLSATGYTAEEISGQNWFTLFLQPDSRGPILNRFHSIINGDETIEFFENDILRKNGEKIFIKWNLIKLNDPEGNVTGMACLGVNITERKLYEINLLKKNKIIRVQNLQLKQVNHELIEAKEKAEESDRLKSAFLANMSHEIRTPMNGILGFAELLQNPELTGDEMKEYLNIIKTSGLRMLNIINNLIDISRVESGLMKISLSPVDVNAQMDYLFNFFKPEAESKGLQLTLHKDLSDNENIIISDREKIYAILTNLLKNAIKYSKTGMVEFGYLKKAEFLEYYVKDNGIGIPQKLLSAVFERFVQADSSYSSSYEGAGLGLSIAKAFTEMLGGKIRVDSKQDAGSQFYFTIPYIPALESPETIITANPDLTPENRPDYLKILIAEDDEISMKLLSKIVGQYTSNIFHAINGLEVVGLCRDNPDIDLILIDLKMPGLDGLEATRQIRTFNSDVVIIAQTAYALSGDREISLEAGCHDHITKPLDKAKLEKIIRDYTGSLTKS